MRLKFPSVLSTRVTFPRDQVLSSTRGSSVGANSFYLVFFFFINELTRLRNEVGAELWGFFVRREKQSIEDAMHLPGRKEAIGDRHKGK